MIEVMVVVAIVAILASVALPSYSDYVRRSALPEAFTYLSDYRIKMEQYYQDNRNYGTTNCADGGAAPAWNTFAPTGTQHFTFGCARTAAGQGYTLTATGVTGKASDGHVYTINADNAKATTRFKSGVVTKSCWLVKGGEC